MSNRIEAVLAGVGTTDELAATLSREDNSGDSGTSDRGRFVSVILEELANPVLGPVLLSTVAAWMNRNFEKTGRLYRYDAKHGIDVSYISDDKSRAIIDALMHG